VTELSPRTWKEVERFFDERLVVLQPLGATEPHGPHLPLDTDVTIARALASSAAGLLEREGVATAVLPPIAYGLSRLTEGFAGWISLRPGTLWAILEDVIESLTEQGVRRLVLVNAHFEPEHAEILAGVILDHPRVTPREPQVLHPDLFSPALLEELPESDLHAGRHETALMLHLDPDAVRGEIARGLAPVPIEASRVGSGAKALRKAGAEEAYCGDPAAADSGEGADRMARLTDEIGRSVREAWPELFA
jgi:creatinine amidohydrolase